MKEQQAINLRRNGSSYGDISTALGISKSTAYKYCKEVSVNKNYSEYSSNERSEKRSFEAEYETIRTLYAVANKKLEYLTKNNTSLEQRVHELEIENKRLSNQNSDLIIKDRTAEKEKEIAVKEAVLECKANNNSGLGALTDPQLWNVFGDLAVKVIPMFKKPDPNSSIAEEFKQLSQAKRDAVYCIAATILPLSDLESSKLIWLINDIVNKNKIEEFFVNWQKKPE